MRPSDDPWAGTAGAAAEAGGAEESPSSVMAAAARRAAGKFISNKSTANTETLRMFAPQKSELNTRETVALLSKSNGWPRVTRPKVQARVRDSAAAVRPGVAAIELLNVKLL